MSDRESPETNDAPNGTEPGEAGEPADSSSPLLNQDAAMMFLKEVAILLVGLMVGFFWRVYSAEVGNEGHLIIALLITILCLVRFIYIAVDSRGKSG